jgi:nitrite reductase/ring-hydroxylating ferredoxin subunit/uncharacterized membrane protein
MILKDLLQGKPLGHPLHPVLVHMPIGLFALSLLFDVASYTLGGALWVQAAFYTVALGALMGLVASVPGIADWSDIRLDNPAKKTANQHLVLNAIAIVLNIASALLRMNALDITATPVLPFALSVISMGLIGVSGYLGGSLVYADGIGVGRHRRTSPPQPETATITEPKLENGYVRIAGGADLAQGETMRVKIHGNVVTLVKDAGQIYAIDEFCSHMFGPLSDGRVCNGQVECPWHSSKFDLKTGKVVQGPAEKPIRVFKVIVREDDVFLHLTQKDTPEPVKV